MTRRLKRNLTAGLAVLGVAGLAGGAYAATQNSGPSSRQAFLNDVAKRLHVTPQQLNQALSGALDDQLQAAVRDGRLTQAQANQLEQRLKQNGGAGAPFFLRPRAFGGPRAFAVPKGGLVVPKGVPAPKGFAGPPGIRAPRLGFPGPGPLGAAAKYLGLSDEQLFRQLASGKSLAQIATAKGKTASGLEQAMTAALKSKLDRAVADKLITAAQEKQALNQLSSRLSAMINHKGLPFQRPRLLRPLRPGGGAAPKNLPSPPKGGSLQLVPPVSPTA